MGSTVSEASTAVASPPAQHEPLGPTYSLGQIVRYALYLGTFGFGGPVALVGYMHRDLVERRKWVTEADYKEGLTLSQIMPGPLAAQLAIYLGHVHYGLLGATLVGAAFVLPSFVMVVSLGWAYRLYGGLPWMQAVFYGVGGCVIGIICVSAVKLTQKTIANSALLWGVYLASAAATVITESESVWLFLGAGVLVWLVRTPPKFLRFGSTTASLLPLGWALPGVPQADYDTLGRMLLFFTKAGAFVFGSGLAIVPFLYGGVVTQYGWLNDQEFLDAVAVAMVTPGPVVITVSFVGFLVGGFSGATVAAIGTFLPCYLFTVIPAPYFKKHGKRPAIIAFVDGVTAAAVGAIAGAVVVLGQRTILNGWAPDPFKLAVLLATIALLWNFKKLPEPVLVAGAAVTGWMVYPWTH